MTNRDFYTAVINVTITDEVVDFAKDSIAKLDMRNAKRSSKAKEVNEPIKAKIVAFLTDKDFVLRTDICKAFADFTPQKVNGLLVKMFESGILEQIEIKVEKVGKRKAYKLA